MPNLLLAAALSAEQQCIQLTASSLEWSEITAAAADGSEQQQLPRFSMVAYTGGLMRVTTFFRPIVLDLAGMRRAAKSTPILKNHDANQLVGHSDEVDISPTRLTLAGVVSGTGPAAQEVLATAKNKFPWQASVGVGIEELESLNEGSTAVVNGQTVRGPALIARRTLLGEVSFVPGGADGKTSARVAASQSRGSSKMTFEEFVAAQGFDVAALSESQAKFMQKAFAAEQNPTGPPATPPKGGQVKAAAGGDDGEDPVALARKNVRAAVAEELQSVERIREICAKHGDPELTIEATANGVKTSRKVSIAAHAVEQNWSVDKTELEAMRKGRAKGPAIHMAGEEEILGKPLEASLCLSAGISEDTLKKHYDEKTLNMANSLELRGAGLHTLMYEVIRATGKYVRPGRVNNAVIRAALDADRELRASGGFSNVSMSGTLSNVANKALLESYFAVPVVSNQICSQVDHSDFKQHTRYRMTGSGKLEKVGPTGELKHTELSDQTYSNQIDTVGRMITLNRQQLTNDDLGAFLQIPKVLGRMTALSVEEAVFSLVLSNLNSFFHANNKNLATGAGSALSISGLTAQLLLFRQQVDADGKPIVLAPSILLVPAALEVLAGQLFKDQFVNETTTANKSSPNSNPHAGKYRPVVSPYLDNPAMTGYSATGWYLFGNPNDIAAVELAYLMGARTPTIESAETDFNVLGMQWRCYFDFGVAFQDHRAATKANGQ